MLLVALAVGTLGQYLTLAAVIIAAWLIYRGGGAGALSVLETANRVLEKRVDELERQRVADAETIAELRGRTDVALALAPLVGSLEKHEERAQARADRALDVLNLIADRLGPDNGDRAG